MSKDFSSAGSKPGEVVEKPLPSGNDRAERIGRIISRIKELAGTDAAKTIVQDEAKNLQSFLGEEHKGFEHLKESVKAVLQ